MGRPASVHAAYARRLPAGGGLALVTAITALLAHLGLRAAADGPLPGTPALVGGTLLLTLILWPLAARTTKVRTLTGVFVSAQLGTHAIAVLAGGWTPQQGARGLVCCPSADQTGSGLLGRLTANAGWALLAAQLLACVVLAVAVHGTRRGLDLVSAAVALVASILTAVAVRLCLLAPAPAAAPAFALPAAPDAGVRPSLLPVRRRPRRGPPRTVRTALSLA